MLVTVLSYEVYAFDNAIPTQRLRQRIKHHTVASAKKGNFFLKHEKKGRCFSPSAQKRYVRRFHASQRNILYQHTCKLFISVSYKTRGYVQGH
jgi:hypothetical protein